MTWNVQEKSHGKLDEPRSALVVGDKVVMVGVEKSLKSIAMEKRSKKSSIKLVSKQVEKKMELYTGLKIWVPDARLLWTVGEVVSVLDGNTVTVYVSEALEDPHRNVTISETLPFDPSHFLNHSDATQINNMHVAALLHLLRQRYQQDDIYTFTADVLISVNPYKPIPLLYDVAGFMQESQKCRETGKSRKPHLFSVAEKAYEDMSSCQGISNGAQSIIISGESGAGKTEASKYIMRYLSTASHNRMTNEYARHPSLPSGATNTHEKIEECVLQSNVVLEAFGNAKTSRNDNSSRFGKYIQILYNRAGRMVGVAIRHFLLEKTRIVRPEKEERNYHVFYQMIAGLDKKSIERLHLREASFFHILNHGACVSVEGVDDAKEFMQLSQSLTLLGISAIMQQCIFKILAGILHLGNVKFVESESEDESVKVQCKDISLDTLAEFFGFSASEFERKLTYQTTTAGRTSLVQKALTCDEAFDAMQAFCKTVYGEIFNWLVERINDYCRISAPRPIQLSSSSSSSSSTSPLPENEPVPVSSLSSPSTTSTTTSTCSSVASKTSTKSSPVKPNTDWIPQSFIGILDIFGFEVMDNNGFEQLCINYANEMLQQQFNKHIFVLEQERYVAEGIHFSLIEFKDNQNCLDLISKAPSGLLPLLDEQVMLKRKISNQQLLTIYHQTHLGKHACYDKPRFASNEFIVKHYAGGVTYDIDEFVEKNTDNLHEDLMQLLQLSEDVLLEQLFSPLATRRTLMTLLSPCLSFPCNNNNSYVHFMDQGKDSRNQVAFHSAGRGGRSRNDHLPSSPQQQLKHRRQPSNSSSSTTTTITSTSSSNVGGGGGGGNPTIAGLVTVASTFREQLTGLMDMLWSTTPHYVKCIKPNNVKFPGGFSSELVCDQLIYSGVLEMVRIRQQGYPVRRPFEQFYQTFGALVNSSYPLKKTLGCIQRICAACQKIAETHLEASAFQLGRTEVYLRYGQLEILQSILHHVRMDSVARIQSVYRTCLAQRAYRKLRTGMILFQAKLKAISQRRKFLIQKKSILLLQTLARMLVQRTRYQEKKRAASILHHYGHKFLIRLQSSQEYRRRRASLLIQNFLCRYQRQRIINKYNRLATQAAVVCQSKYRQYLQQSRYHRLLAHLVRIQAAYRAYKARILYTRGKNATVTSQALFRRALQRRKFLRQKRLAIRLQSVIRKWLAQRRFVRWRKRFIQLQAFIRRRCLRQLFVRKRRGCVKIQSTYRMFLLQRSYQKVMSQLPKAQAILRGYLQRTLYAQQLSSIRCMQTFWRKFSHGLRCRRTIQLVHHLISTGQTELALNSLRIHRDLVGVLNREQGFQSFLHTAVLNDDISLAEFLIKSRPTLLMQQDAWGNTPLHCAAEKGCLRLLKFLARKSNDIYMKDINTNERLLGSTTTLHRTTSRLRNSVDATGITILAGSLKKRRETSCWMNRWVVLRSEPLALHYYKSRKLAQTQRVGDKVMDLTKAMFKKSSSVPYSFEIHSPELIQGRNLEGRLYFQAENEMELQKWLSCLRDTIPSTVESRLFQMQRKEEFKFIDWSHRRALVNIPNIAKETPLHLAARWKARQRDNAEPDETKGVQAVLWLLENGSNVDLVSSSGKTPLKEALDAKNYEIARHLLDRCASVANILDEDDHDTIQQLRLALSKEVDHAHAHLPMCTEARLKNEAPVALLKQPGVTRNSSYLSIYVEQLGMPLAESIEKPRIIISVYDPKRNLVEAKQQVSMCPVRRTNMLWYSFTWHMQTPLENLSQGAYVVFELFSTSKNPQLGEATPAPEPICWTYVPVDKKTANTGPLNAEMYQHPINMKLTRLQRVDAFISGDMFVSQG